MTRRTRKLVGAAVMLGFVTLYALFAMAVAQAPAIQTSSGLVQGLCYAVLGLIWILPMFPLVKWMERKDA